MDRPKTKSSVRTISLGAEGLAALRTALQIQDDDFRLLGTDRIDDGWVFANHHGKHLHPDSVSKRFRRDIQGAEVPSLRFHELRHTFATTALAQKSNPKLVAEVLGHSNVTTTLSVYSHVLPGAHAETVESVESALFGLSSGREGDESRD